MAHEPDPQPVGPPVMDWTPPAIPPRTPIDGRYVRIEPLSVQEHGGELFEAFDKDPEGRNWTYRSDGPFAGRDDFLAWLAAIENDEARIFFAYRDLATGRALGMGAFMAIAPASGSMEVGFIMFSPEMQRTRAATEAMYLKMKWAFEAGYRRYEWTCHSMNAASMAAAMRFGFSFEAVFRQATVNKGRNRSTSIFACLDSEWPTLQAAYETWLQLDNFSGDGQQKTGLSQLTRPLLRPNEMPLPDPETSPYRNRFEQPLGPAVANWVAPSVPERRTLTGNYCSLEPLDRRHGHGLHDALSADHEGRTWTYMPNGPFDGFDSYDVWLQDAAASPDPLQFAIIVDGKPLGTASFLRINPASGSIEVGYITYSPALQRTRAATETMYLMMKWAFDAGYRRYEWKCNALNAPSCAAARRLGFTYEGTFRQMMVVKGRNRDSAWFSITDAEWPAIREAMESWLAPVNFDEHGNQKLALSKLTG